MAEKTVKIVLSVCGMTCVSCENRIENKIKKLDGVTSVTASYTRSRVSITYVPDRVKLSTIVKTIESMDYHVKRADENKNNESVDKKNKIKEVLGIVIIIIAAYVLVDYFGGFSIFNSFPEAKLGVGYGALFLIGLLTSIHCVAMCGGINLSQCVPNVSIKSEKMTASAVLVLILGVFMFSNGMSLSGIALPSLTSRVAAVNEVQQNNTASVNQGVQTITTKLSPNRYEPITVQVGVPVKWTIEADENDINGCNNQVLIPEYNIEKKLVAGDNVIEFTPTETGRVPYSCWMVMIKSTITIVN